MLSASYRYTRDALTGNSTVDQVDFAGQWPLSAHWYAVGRYNYSLRDKQAARSDCRPRVQRQLLVGAHGCAAPEGHCRHRRTTHLFFQLELNDFGSIGADPIGLLRRSIPGYGKINELPTSSSLLTP